MMSHPTFFFPSLKEWLFIFFAKPKKKKRHKRVKGLRSLLKATFFKIMAAADFLFVVRIGSMQHLPRCCCLLLFFFIVWVEAAASKLSLSARPRSFCHAVVLFTHLPQRVGPDKRTRQDHHPHACVSLCVTLQLCGWKRPVFVWNLTWNQKSHWAASVEAAGPR